ncbi:DUF4399 domain-containing protein [Jannaschia pohangensis]|uniref:DUF4399 domain-containing protein n=1 Tax=Jannaschia pohangensis TaxID=390807 RepID=A0A1I3II47_9RHOB|nr:DUF4399 domain-containing protein [Jannaschia pohangensis]SFI47549.1 protein of unknown function [Jannaschia pohangensis]
MTPRILATAFAVSLALPGWAQDTPAPEGAMVYFVNLEDGATVTSPVTVIFGLSGMGVAPAGTEKENTGHHHLLIDRPAFGSEDPEELDFGIPADDNHVHFGGGQTETTLDLPPGEHTLQLVLGDLNHVVHATPVASDVITIIVE